MDRSVFSAIALTGFSVAFFHAAIPTHWLPFFITARAQRWSRAKTLAVTALAGCGHVLFTAILGFFVAWGGIALNEKFGDWFPWLAGGALIAFGLYYVIQQIRGKSHGHSHMFGGYSHGHVEASTGPEGGAKQDFAFEARSGLLESTTDIPEPHEFKALVKLSHGDHVHRHQLQFEEHHHNHSHGEACGHLPAQNAKSDWAAVVSLMALLTFSPCEGFLPVYVSGVRYGWGGFFTLTAILSVATVVGMIAFTWLTLVGMERLKLTLFEKYEQGILGGLLCFLGALVIFLEH